MSSFGKKFEYFIVSPVTENSVCLPSYPEHEDVYIYTITLKLKQRFDSRSAVQSVLVCLGSLWTYSQTRPSLLAIKLTSGFICLYLNLVYSASSGSPGRLAISLLAALETPLPSLLVQISSHICVHTTVDALLGSLGECSVSSANGTISTLFCL